MRRRHALRRKRASDLGETSAACVLEPDPLDDTARKGRRPTGRTSVQSRDHAGEVTDRGDRGSDAAPERLAVGGAAEVVVTAGPRRLGDELELPVAIDVVFRALAVVFLPGYSRPMIRVEEFLELLERCTFRDDGGRADRRGILNEG